MKYFVYYHVSRNILCYIFVNIIIIIKFHTFHIFHTRPGTECFNNSIHNIVHFISKHQIVKALAQIDIADVNLSES